MKTSRRKTRTEKPCAKQSLRQFNVLVFRLACVRGTIWNGVSLTNPAWMKSVTGRVELVSRTISVAEEWQDQLDRVFKYLFVEWDIRLTTGCSMHVHVSTGTTMDTRFTMEQVRQILKGIALYDDAITKIMPADRKNNEWAMSNFRSRQTPARLKQLYAAVPTHTWAPLFGQFDKIKRKEMVYLELQGQNKLFCWNFNHLSLTCGTVEFRRSPGVRSAAEAKHWAGVALGFVSQAMVADYKPFMLSKQYPGVESLPEFLAERG
ncbi:hypothetical protein F4818DRAFT_397456 [Hypoxylon cercidicola]|nr:hypothetical protein F4818DRAFT_397456 [Hypoxylon cercidicola]